MATTLSNLEGVESHQVSRILGHAQTTETNRTYAKTDITRLQAILSRMKYDCDPFLLRGMTPLNEEEISAQTSRLPVLETF